MNITTCCLVLSSAVVTASVAQDSLAAQEDVPRVQVGDSVRVEMTHAPGHLFVGHLYSATRDSLYITGNNGIQGFSAPNIRRVSAYVIGSNRSSTMFWNGVLLGLGGAVFGAVVDLGRGLEDCRLSLPIGDPAHGEPEPDCQSHDTGAAIGFVAGAALGAGLGYVTAKEKVQWTSISLNEISVDLSKTKPLVTTSRTGRVTMGLTIPVGR